MFVKSFIIFSKYKILCIICVILLAGYGVFIEPFAVRFTRIQVSDPVLSGFFIRHRTVLLSDIHATALGIREKMVLSKIAKIDPDLVLLAGDYVSWDGNYDRAVAFLSKIRAKEGVFAVMGDSDYQDSRQSCRFCHRFDREQPDFPIRFLRNERVFLQDEKARVALTGLEMFQNHKQEAADLLGSPPNCAEIVVSQKQVEIQTLAGRRILFLSGDTHGGQVFMPDILWEKLFGRSKGRIRKGSVKKKDARIVVTSGIGTNTFPFRFLCPPEIILFEGKHRSNRD